MPRRRARTYDDSALSRGRSARHDTQADEGGPDRTTDETDPPDAALGAGEGLDFEDVGPTEVGERSRDDVRLGDADVTDVGERGHADVGDESFELPVAGDTVDGRYVIERELGRGATGVVYEASHRLIGSRLALKCLHPQMSTSPVAVQRLFREARISASLRHPNVTQVFDAGRDGDLYYLTMELLEGEPMSAFLGHGARPLPDVIPIFLAIMDGVAAVHGAGVVHRDLKPDNVFITRDEEGRPRPKVLDFGVSKLYEPDRQQLTGLGTTMGTPYYMAPEQVTDSRGVDVRADVYSLGVMLYEAVSGTVPYAGESMLEIFTRVIEGRPVALRNLRPETPPSLEALVARALCADRDARFADVRSMREALAAVPFDGSDLAQDWSDVSEPWMLDPSSGRAEVQPLDSVPTHVGGMPKGGTVEMPSPAALARPATDEGAGAQAGLARGSTLEMQPGTKEPDLRVLFFVGAGVLVLGAAGAAAFVLWLLLA